MALAMIAAAATLTLSQFGNAIAQTAEPKVKILAVKGDPLKKAILIGRVLADGMALQLEIEGAESMWMQMGNPPVWGAHAPGADERYHVRIQADGS